jgi:hypoxanthine phosphoribosyltransferase
MARETLTWADFGRAGRELAVQIDADGFRPDIILAIARGGLFPAGALGYALDVKNLHVINVEFYTGVDQRLDMPVVLPPVPYPSRSTCPDRACSSPTTSPTPARPCAWSRTSAPITSPRSVAR